MSVPIRAAHAFFTTTSATTRSTLNWRPTGQRSIDDLRRERENDGGVAEGIASTVIRVAHGVVARRSQMESAAETGWTLGSPWSERSRSGLSCCDRPKKERRRRMGVREAVIYWLLVGFEKTKKNRPWRTKRRRKKLSSQKYDVVNLAFWERGATTERSHTAKNRENR